MSDTEVMTTSGGKPEAVVKFDQFKGFIEKMRPEIMKVLPQHLRPDHFLRCIMTYALRSPEVLSCEPASVAKSIMDAAQMGLAPDGLLGSAYLVPFRKKGAAKMHCQLIPGYRGLIDLARRSAAVMSVEARVVREGDEFQCRYGSKPEIVHVPDLGASHAESPIIAAYAVATMANGAQQFEVLTKADLQKIKASSQSARGEFSPWNTWEEEQSRKSAVKRLSKYLPLSPELARAIEIDNAAEVGDLEAPRAGQSKGGMDGLAKALLAGSDAQAFEEGHSDNGMDEV